MKLQLSNPIDKQKFNTYSEKLIEQEKFVELREIKPVRTNQQNRYLHLLFNYFAMETGYTLNEVKQVIFKQLINPNIFKSEFTDKFTGEVVTWFRSTADLDTAEMTTAIDRLRNWSSATAGIYLPEANEKEFLEQIEREAEFHKKYI